MKVLIINVDVGTGSVGRIIESIYYGVINSGNQCKIAYGRNAATNIPEQDLYHISNRFDINTHALLSRIFGRSGFYSHTVTKRFLSWIDEYQPDLINIHSLYGYFVNVEILLRYIASKNIRTILTLHSCWDFTGHCCYFDLNKCDKWKAGCNMCKYIFEYPKSYYIDDTSKNYRKKKELYNDIKDLTVVTPSDWMKDLVKQSFLRNKKVITIHNGIDLTKYTIAKADEKFDRPTIICVANGWTRRKGLEDVIELSNVLPQDMGLIVVGVNKKQIKELPSNVQAIERTDSMDELINLYHGSTVFFNPTYEENYPTVNLEAIACGLPVATYNTGGCVETLGPSMQFGMVIQRKDYLFLINYTYNIYKNGISIRAKDINNYYSNKTMTSQYLDLFLG